jgi:tetratricopeptide (TPR) repeat protein
MAWVSVAKKPMNAMPSTGRAGGDARGLIDRFRLPGGGRPVGESLRGVTADGYVLQEFRPLCLSLEWELADLYWATRGVAPFVSNEVPHLINNSGRASEDAAVLLFTNCREAERLEDRIVALELGAGLGLFAAGFLNAFRELCAQEGRDYYDRLRYYVTDRSRRSVESWQEVALFEGHGDRVVAATCDARRPGVVEGLDGTCGELTGVRAVLANYVLDVLPAAVVRAGPEGPEQLCVRTHLVRDDALRSRYTRLGLNEIRALAASDDPEERAGLLPLLTLLEYEVGFFPVAAEPPPHLAEALAFGEGLERIVLNHGAIDCVAACLERVRPGGFVLVNDYGPTQRAEIAGHGVAQRFGSSTALGLNFPLLEHHFGEAGRVVVVPEGEATRSIHARLFAPDPVPATAEMVASRYGAGAVDDFEAPADEARRHAAAGRLNEALESYRIALTRNPRDWLLIGQAAEFVALQLKDYAPGLELIRAALEANPHTSPWLWNVLGDCLFCLGRFDDAHEAYGQARRIDPLDVRTNFNLSYTYAQAGAYREALEAIGAALAGDAQGAYRTRLLDKQQQILAALSERWLGEQERLTRRAAVFS